MLKFIYSEKATKFCEISTLEVVVCSTVKSKAEIMQNFVALSEYMIFKRDFQFKSVRRDFQFMFLIASKITY